jgi:hypothetical protein
VFSHSACVVLVSAAPADQREQALEAVRAHRTEIGFISIDADSFSRSEVVLPGTRKVVSAGESLRKAAPRLSRPIPVRTLKVGRGDDLRRILEMAL